MATIVVGSLNVDQISYCPRLPAGGETILGTRYETGLGGKGANQAVQCALLGTKTIMIGAVGDDSNGQWYLDNLPLSGVDCSYIRTIKNTSTGVAPITVSTTSAENSIIVVPGANILLTPDHLDFEFIAANGKIVVCQNEIAHETTSSALKFGRRSGLITVYSPAPCPPQNLFLEFADNVDYLIANEMEAAELSGIEDIESAARKMAVYGVKTVIVTLGAKGYAILEDNHFERFDAIKVDAIDTTGAGDSFVGSFVHALANGLKTAAAAKFASRCAAISVTRKGTQKSYPTMKEITI